MEPPPTSEKDWQIHVEFTAYTLPRKIAEPLLDDLTNDQKAKAAYEKVREAAKKGAGKLSSTLTASTEHNVRAVAENTTEERYGIEFETPHFPNLDSSKELAALSKNTKALAITPTTFDTRNCGFFLEATPEVSPDGRSLRINAELRHTQFLGYTEYASGMTPQGTRMYVTQPRFTVDEDKGTFFLTSEAPVLAGVHFNSGGKDCIELFFLRAWTKRKPAAFAK